MGHWETEALASAEWPLGYHPCDIGILTCGSESVSYTHLDSSGVGLILGRQRCARSLGGTLRIQHAPEQLRRVLRLANIPVSYTHLEQQYEERLFSFGYVIFGRYNPSGRNKNALYHAKRYRALLF